MSFWSHLFDSEYITERGVVCDACYHRTGKPGSPSFSDSEQADGGLSLAEGGGALSVEVE